MFKIRLITLLGVLVLLLAACANSGAPTSYSDQLAEYQGEPNVSLAERNYREGCEQSGADDIEQRVKDNIVEVCKCSYDGIRENLTFEEFKDLDDDLRSNINADLGNEVAQIIRGCILTEAGLG
ncbi:MAG: hypothetical protein OXE93_06440 [bacterium]|nr:hypothetical protein [bacterium]MCY4163836.1 hypothetical protein [bacterium]MCY4258564.1 hypothetical protein [bacterium]